MPKQAFGGYSVDFTGRTETIEDVFGDKDLTPPQMTKILWAYIKKHQLGGKGKAAA